MQQHHPLGAGAPDYDEDFYAWTQHQAKLLRASGKTASDLPSGIDLGHLAEEIEDLGKAELRAVTSLIRQIMVHLIKAASAPQSDASAHWRGETATFHAELPGYYAPSMRQLIDIQSIWARALDVAEGLLSDHGDRLSPSLPSECFFTPDDFLVEKFVPDEAMAKLATASRNG